MFSRVTSDVGLGIFGGSVISRLGIFNRLIWRLSLTPPCLPQDDHFRAYVMRKSPVSLEKLG